MSICIPIATWKEGGENKLSGRHDGANDQCNSRTLSCYWSLLKTPNEEKWTCVVIHLLQKWFFFSTTLSLSLFCPPTSVFLPSKYSPTPITTTISIMKLVFVEYQCVPDTLHNNSPSCWENTVQILESYIYAMLSVENKTDLTKYLKSRDFCKRKSFYRHSS